jgi:hypothetical protein
VHYYLNKQTKAEKNKDQLTDIKIIKEQDNALTGIKIIKDQDNVLAEQCKGDLKPVDEILSNDGKPSAELLVKKNTKCKDLHPILLGRAV